MGGQGEGNGRVLIGVSPCSKRRADSLSSDVAETVHGYANDTDNNFKSYIRAMAEHVVGLWVWKLYSA